MPVENLLKGRCPIRVNAIWIADFTELTYKGRKFYLATVVDYLTREVVGVSIQMTHAKELVLESIERAVSSTGTVPGLLHSDQGSEYLCGDVLDYLYTQGITPSFSAKSSPWQNSRQESFFSRFKHEMPDLSKYETFGEAIAQVLTQITYYNTQRIHTSLGMSPVRFREAIQAAGGQYRGPTNMHRKMGS